MLRRLSLILSTIIFWHLSIVVTLAETKKLEQMDKFPPSPLEMIISDPLVRDSVEQQPLTTEELQTLEIALDQLNQQAANTLQAGDQETAFEIWNRELRLRRFFGLLAEMEALSRVGAIAWNENQRQQVQYITQRLQVIEKLILMDKNSDLQLWRSLAEAYQNIRFPKLAIGVYGQILTSVRKRQDINSEIETLNKIAELHLSWFDYPQAAITYQELLNLANSQNDQLNQVVYVKQLVYIYEKTKQYQQAIYLLNKLAEIYTRDNNLSQVPSLKIAIAENYQAVAQENRQFLQQAFNTYQEAYVIAWNAKNYVSASEAIQKLIKLYRSQNQIDAALQATQILLETETLANNLYGVMQVYDQMGELYLKRQEKAKALIAFQKGLELANKLKHQQKYFTQKIEKLS